MSLQQSSEIILHGIYVAVQDSANVGLNLHRKCHMIFESQAVCLFPIRFSCLHCIDTVRNTKFILQSQYLQWNIRSYYTLNFTPQGRLPPRAMSSLGVYYKEDNVPEICIISYRSLGWKRLHCQEILNSFIIIRRYSFSVTISLWWRKWFHLYRLRHARQFQQTEGIRQHSPGSSRRTAGLESCDAQVPPAGITGGTAAGRQAGPPSAPPPTPEKPPLNTEHRQGQIFRVDPLPAPRLRLLAPAGPPRGRGGAGQRRPRSCPGWRWERHGRGRVSAFQQPLRKHLVNSVSLIIE